MRKIKIDPKSELIQKHKEKLGKYEVFEEKKHFTVYNTENKHKHVVKVLKISNLEYMADCDCEDWLFRREKAGEACIHIFTVIYKAQVEDKFDIENYNKRNDIPKRTKKTKLFWHTDEKRTRIDLISDLSSKLYMLILNIDVENINATQRNQLKQVREELEKSLRVVKALISRK